MLEFIKTIINTLKVYIDKKFASSKADWNQNNESADNYIKNRPFYEEEINSVILKKTNFEIRDGMQQVLPNIALADEGQYKVIFDEKTYLTKAKYQNGIDEINFNIYFEDGSYIFIDCLGYVYLENTDSSIIGAHTIEILTYDVVTHKIDEKYLPNSYDTFFITFSKDENEKWSVDKTFDEIIEAYNNSKNIVGVTNVDGEHQTTYIPLETVEKVGEGIFHNFIFTGGTYSSSTDAVSNYSALISAEGLVTLFRSYVNASEKMDRNNPVGTGSFSMNRKHNTTIGQFSHAEGFDTEASGQWAHAEGFDTVAYGEFSHAEGFGAVAFGSGSHAEGTNTEAFGRCSHAEGDGTIASGLNQHVQGEYNINDVDVDGNNLNTYAHIVGNGTDDNNRSNAHTLDWEGNAWFSGDVYTGSTSGTNRDEGSKKLASEEYVDNAVANAGGSAVFTVNITENEDDEGNITYSADKTFAEIIEAFNDKKVVVLNDGYGLSTLYSIEEYCATFTSVHPLTESIGYNAVEVIIDINDVVDYVYAHQGVDITEYNNLKTTKKTIIGAINELNAKHTDGTDSLILLSPNGTRFSITVGDDGVLTATEITE